MMIELTNQQLQYIQDRLANEQVTLGSLNDELLDHLCCTIETKLQSGITFHIACDQAFQSFGENGIQELQSQTIYLLNQKSRRMKNAMIAAMVIAIPFLFFSLNRLSSNYSSSINASLTESAATPPACKHMTRPEEKKTYCSTTEQEVLKSLDLKLPFIDEAEPPSIHPLQVKTEVTSGYGIRLHPLYKVKKLHTGVDFRVPIGTPVIATSDGVVEVAKKELKGKGNHIVLKHDVTYNTAYWHLEDIKVTVGQKVKKGEVIGTVGTTGTSVAPHLHYEVRVKGKAVDPQAYLKP